MQYDFNLTPNGSQVLEVAGSYFRYKGGLGAIRVTPSSGDAVELLPGQGMENVKFDRLIVKDLSGAANAGAVLAGSGNWRDERITGSVEVIDGGKNRTVANQAFMATTYCGGQAGNTAQIQLWNPALSGKRVIVARVTRGSATAGTVAVGITAVALVTKDKNAQSKLSGGAASVAELRVESKVGASGLAALTSNVVQAGVDLQFQFLEPVVLLPGYGLVLSASTLAADVLGAFEFFEEAIQ